MQTAYTDAAGRTLPDFTELYSGDLTGKTLVPGLYKWGTGVQISAGGVTISGSATDVWIFQIAQNLTVANNAIVSLSGGAQASNIFWQVAGQATLGTTAQMKGIILSQTQISMNTGATLEGRALAQTAVTLIANAVTQPVPVVVTLPTVTSTDPLNAATGVTLNKQIAATFSTAMDASTITASTFTLMQGAASVSGVVSYSGSTAILTPASNLLPNTLYTATITTGAKNAAGDALANDYVWSFTTAAAVATPPVITSTDPLNLATGVVMNKHITAMFSTAMDASTITASTVMVKQGTTSVAGTVSYSGTTATFIPASNLLANMLYEVTFTTGAKDLAGNALTNNYVWSFTTAAAAIIPPTVNSIDPLNIATGVAMNKQITATFSTAMDASTITTSTFMVKQGTTAVPGVVSYSGTTATFVPASNLKANTLYTVTITTGVKDVTGNALTNNMVWSFTTIASGTSVENDAAPQIFSLSQNYPNPFNPSTMIQYSLENATRVSLKVYNLIGVEVATLVSGRQEAGSYTVPFGIHNGSFNLASGMYFYRLEAGSFVSTKKLILLK